MKKGNSSFKSLASAVPDLAAQWHPTLNGDLTPSEVTSKSSKKAWWRGGCGHEWESVICSRTQGAGCPYCSGLRPIKGFNDLLTSHPDIAKEWHPNLNYPLTPDNVSHGSEKRIWWIGECGHEWRANINSRTRDKYVGCPYCSGNKTLAGFNDLETLVPDVAAQWHPTKNGEIKPNMVTRGTNTKAWWIGECGHEWEAAVSSRSKGIGCPVCHGLKVLTGFNDFETTNPSIAKEWHPTKNGDIKPSQVITKTNTVYWWLGACGHEWKASPHNRSVGTGCTYCKGNNILTGFNDLETLNPLLAKEWHPTLNGKLKPSMVTKYNNKKAWWLGACGHEWEAIISSRTSGNGCSVCHGGGFKFEKASTFYFIENYSLKARKVGISNSHTKRIANWVKNGWVLHYSLEASTGKTIHTLETTIKRWIKQKHNLHPVLTLEDVGWVGGWTETFTNEVLNNQEIIEKIKHEWATLNKNEQDS